MIDLEAQIEAILFYRGEPTSFAEIAHILEISEDEVRETTHALATSLAARGIRVIGGEKEATLATAPGAAPLIEKLRKSEIDRDISKAASETLAIILYKGPLTRAEIDYIRGVNSTFILRNLLTRGLIEKQEHPEDQRTFLYAPSLELLAHMGITRIEELPEFDKVKRELQSFTAQGLGEEALYTNDKTNGGGNTAA